MALSADFWAWTSPGDCPHASKERQPAVNRMVRELCIRFESSFEGSSLRPHASPPAGTGRFTLVESAPPSEARPARRRQSAPRCGVEGYGEAGADFSCR